MAGETSEIGFRLHEKQWGFNLDKAHFSAIKPQKGEECRQRLWLEMNYATLCGNS